MTWNSSTLRGPTGGDPYGGGMPAGTFQFTFNTPGTYNYHCSNHPRQATPASRADHGDALANHHDPAR
jgi:hypothetical protein